MTKNFSESLRFFLLAANQGNARAQYNIGLLSENGDGLPKDLSVALNWYRIAANNGLVEAQSKIAEIEAGRPKLEVGTTEIPVEADGGTFVVSVSINDSVRLKFTLDSGASDVSIPADVVWTLFRSGTVKQEDFTGTKIYTLADGSKIPSQNFRIHSIQVGDKILRDVNGTVGPINGSLLLGQSFLMRFKSWSIDNVRQVLILKPN